MIKKKLKFLSNEKVVHALIIIIFIFFTYLLINILRIPNSYNQINEENNILQETKFNYTAEVLPNILYPTGGHIDIGNGVFTKVTKEILVNINSIIKSDNPVKIEGTKKLAVTIIANELWEKEFILEKESNINFEGSNYILFNATYPIKLNELLGFIKTVEDELDIRPGEYVFNIRPIVKGKIISGDKIIDIDESSFSEVSFSTVKIKNEGENSFTLTTPLNSTSNIYNYINFFNIRILVQNAKYIIGFIYAIYILLIAFIIWNKKINKMKKQSEEEVINKKYRKRIIEVKNNINDINFVEVQLDSFNNLITLSDEKDCSILKCFNLSEVIYYILDENYIYLYKISKDEKGNKQTQLNSFQNEEKLLSTYS